MPISGEIFGMYGNTMEITAWSLFGILIQFYISLLFKNFQILFLHFLLINEKKITDSFALYHSDRRNCKQLFKTLLNLQRSHLTSCNSTNDIFIDVVQVLFLMHYYCVNLSNKRNSRLRWSMAGSGWWWSRKVPETNYLVKQTLWTVVSQSNCKQVTILFFTRKKIWIRNSTYFISFFDASSQDKFSLIYGTIILFLFSENLSSLLYQKNVDSWDIWINKYNFQIGWKSKFLIKWKFFQKFFQELCKLSSTVA